MKILRVLVALGTIVLVQAQTPAAFPGSQLVVNDTSTGTTFQKLAKSSSGKAVISATTDTTALGVCVQNCTTSGSAVIATVGIVGVLQDGNTTVDHWVTLSSSAGGEVTDTGSSTYPACSPTPIVGQVIQGNAGGAGVVAQIILLKDIKIPNCLITQNSQSANYTTLITDVGKQIYHPSADTSARTWTIDSNANVAFPIGTAITFVNDTSAGIITISITSDTLVLAGSGSTGSRSLAANGIATAVKVTSTRWIISGTGLT